MQNLCDWAQQNTTSDKYCLYLDDRIIIEGIYRGKNIYVSNTGYCITDFRVNGNMTTDRDYSAAFEIPLDRMVQQVGNAVKIVIFHKTGCSPKVLNAEVVGPISTFEVKQTSLDSNGIFKWTSINENGSLDYMIEQYKWNKWVKIVVIEGKGKKEKNDYQIRINMHSEKNKVRVKQVDYTGKPRCSEPVEQFSGMLPVKILSLEVSDFLQFSDSSSYEIFDEDGWIKMKGREQNVDVKNLKNGKYYLNVDNYTTKFIKR